MFFFFFFLSFFLSFSIFLFSFHANGANATAPYRFLASHGHGPTDPVLGANPSSEVYALSIFKTLYMFSIWAFFLNSIYLSILIPSSTYLSNLLFKISIYQEYFYQFVFFLSSYLSVLFHSIFLFFFIYLSIYEFLFYLSVYHFFFYLTINSFYPTISQFFFLSINFYFHLSINLSILFLSIYLSFFSIYLSIIFLSIYTISIYFPSTNSLSVYLSI
ncbi:unnamed protein product [Acanthosepion pharaonis]|uniref:Uncharacterized protein n=1 Tax=Acanthosepion pharaonis TaxID=158019 RepID=A0A812CRP0_ACAPH|nr:unnamed protein product [Sepia pharaonis]